METTRRDALTLMGGADGAAIAAAGPAFAAPARNLGSKAKTLFWVASVTPCDKSLKFDPGAFKDVLAWFKHNGADGVVVLGSTGEYPSFNTEERMQIMEVAGKNKDGMNIICSTGTADFPDTIKLSKHAADHGADGVLVIPPFYYKQPPLAGLVRYYSLVFDAVPQSLAVNLYHFPSMSAVPVTTALLNALKHYPNLAGIKDSEDNMPEYVDFVKNFPTSICAPAPISSWNMRCRRGWARSWPKAMSLPARSPTSSPPIAPARTFMRHSRNSRRSRI